MSLAWERGSGKPELSEFRAIGIHCEDCGRTKRMQPREIADHVTNGIHTLMALHNRLRCSVCSERGVGGGKNLSLYPIKRGE